MDNAPHIWTRRPKIIEPRTELILRQPLAGWFRLKVRRPDGRVRHDTGWFPNLITDGGLNLLGTSQSWVEACVVGSGSAAPAESDTSLVSEVASTTNRIDRTGGSNQTSDRYCYGRATFRFAAGAAEGNLAEIGIESGSTLFSRALILDGSGSPTTITVLADEALDCVYEVRNYPPLDDVAAEILIGATPHDIVLRVAEVDTWNVLGGGLGAPIGWMAGIATFTGAAVYGSTSTLGTVLTQPSGTSFGHSGSSNSSYSPASHFREFSYTWGLTSGNASGGIAAVLVAMGSQPTSGEARAGLWYQFSLDPVIPKDGTNNLTLQFRQSWARRSI